MTDYYIRISEEIPENEDPSLWFKVDGDEILILNNNEYVELKGELNTALNSLGENEVLQNAVNTMIAQGTASILNSTNTQNLVEGGNTGNKYTYTSLKNKLDTIESNVNSLSDALSSLQTTHNNDKASHGARLASLETTKTGLAWKKTSFAVAIQGQIMYENDVYYNDYMVSLFLTNLPSHTGTGDWAKLLTFDSSSFQFFPPRIVIEDSAYESFRLTPDGVLYYKISKGGKGYTDPILMMTYPRRTVLDL